MRKAKREEQRVTEPNLTEEQAEAKVPMTTTTLGEKEQDTSADSAPNLAKAAESIAGSTTPRTFTPPTTAPNTGGPFFSLIDDE